MMRLKLIAQRRALSLARRKQAAQALLALSLPKEGKILSFYSKHDEIDTGLLNAYLTQTKQLLLPKIEGETLSIYEIMNMDNDLTFGPFGIAQPKSHCLPALPLLILVPALAFDPRGHRIGYGKGYYDRFLASYPHIPRWGIGFTEQLLPRISNAPHDIPVDRLVLL